MCNPKHEQIVESPADDDPLKLWKSNPRPGQKPDEKKHTGIEFLGDVVR